MSRLVGTDPSNETCSALESDLTPRRCHANLKGEDSLQAGDETVGVTRRAVGVSSHVDLLLERG